jgi:hypothetical protein
MDNTQAPHPEFIRLILLGNLKIQQINDWCVTNPESLEIFFAENGPSPHPP